MIRTVSARRVLFYDDYAAIFKNVPRPECAGDMERKQVREMKIEMGESLCYSWLRHVKGCQVVQTNWKASPQWPLSHREELEAIRAATDRFFQEKYGYHIYKKNASLSQIIQQGECDALGVCLRDGESGLCAVDVAFHEFGLQYGSREATVSKIINKCVRTAMCLYGYFGAERAEIYFASPKINPAVMADAGPCVSDAQKVLEELGYGFTLRVVGNAAFAEEIVAPLLAVSGGIADTNELFLRSCQLLKSAGIRW